MKDKLRQISDVACHASFAHLAYHYLPAPGDWPHVRPCCRNLGGARA